MQTFTASLRLSASKKNAAAYSSHVRCQIAIEEYHIFALRGERMRSYSQRSAIYLLESREPEISTLRSVLCAIQHSATDLRARFSFEE